MSPRPVVVPARRPPFRSSRGGAPGDPGGTPRWLVPVLLALVALFGLSMAWRWWGPGAEDARRAARSHATRTALAGSRAPQPMKGPAPDAPFRVEVLNGSGEPGAAAKLASYLRDGGFNVVLVGSADRYDYVRTLVVARTDRTTPSRAVTRYLGDVGHILQRARSEADVTVIVGRDRGRLPWGEGKEPSGRG
jgi:hypothetical protein